MQAADDREGGDVMTTILFPILRPATRCSVTPARRRPHRSQTVVTRRRVDAQRATAYHEAAHAVIALRLGYRVRHASIVSDAERNGHVRWDNPTNRRGVRDTVEFGSADEIDKIKHLIEHVAIVLFAGAVGHKRHNPRARWRCVATAAQRGELMSRGADYQVALSYVFQLYEGHQKVMDAFWRYLQARAEALVDANWPAIERVAATLIKRQMLDEDEIKQATWPR
jgi:hypothetical protein